MTSAALPRLQNNQALKNLLKTPPKKNMLELKQPREPRYELPVSWCEMTLGGTQTGEFGFGLHVMSLVKVVSVFGR